MLVLRLESYLRKGVYYGGSCQTAHKASRYYYLDHENHSKWHPLPCEDPLLREWWADVLQSQWYFGFANMKQLLDWFPKRNWEKFIEWNDDRTPNQKIGIGSYEIRDDLVKLGTRQLCFRLDRASRVNFDPFERSVAKKIIKSILG